MTLQTTVAVLVVVAVSIGYVWHTGAGKTATNRTVVFEDRRQLQQEWRHLDESNAQNVASSQNVEQILKHHAESPLLQLAEQQYFNPKITQGPYICGSNPCLLPLKSYDSKAGYLMADAGDKRNFVRFQNAYKLAKETIEDKHQMQHLLVEPPTISEVSEQLEYWMEFQQHESVSSSRYPSYATRTEFLKIPNEVVVQLVKILPENETILLGCTQRRLDAAYKRLEQMFTLKSNVTKDIDWKASQEWAKAEFQKLYSLLRDQPCLARDFQVLLTVHSDIVHIEIDRCFAQVETTMESTRTETCITKLKEFEGYFLKTLGALELESEPTAGIKVHDLVSLYSNAHQFEFTKLNLATDTTFKARAHCDRRTCIYPMRYFHGRIGFLAIKGTPKYYDRQSDTYNFSTQVIEKEYGMKHIYLLPPRTMEMDFDFLEWLNERRAMSSEESLPDFHGHLVVQPVQIMKPNKSFKFGCREERSVVSQRIVDFVSEAKDWSTSAQQVTAEFEKLYRLLQDHPCLTADFQIYFTIDGEIVHEHVDRCFADNEYIPQPDTESACLRRIQKIEKMITDSVEGAPKPA